MARWHGKIGYVKNVAQDAPGVFLPQTEVREYTGDLTRNTSRWTTNSDSTNDDLTIDNQVSIVADQYAYQNFYSMKWVELMGAKWKITKVEVQHPRLILTVGGIYNG